MIVKLIELMNSFFQELALKAKMAPNEFTYTDREVILYALGGKKSTSSYIWYLMGLVFAKYLPW